MVITDEEVRCIRDKKDALAAYCEELSAIIEHINGKAVEANKRANDLSIRVNTLWQAMDGCYSCSTSMYRDMAPNEIRALKEWVSDNWQKDVTPNPHWHPVVLSEWNKK